MKELGVSIVFDSDDALMEIELDPRFIADCIKEGIYKVCNLKDINIKEIRHLILPGERYFNNHETHGHYFGFNKDNADKLFEIIGMDNYHRD